MAPKTGKHFKHIFCNVIILNNSASQVLNLPGLFSNFWPAGLWTVSCFQDNSGSMCLSSTCVCLCYIRCPCQVLWGLVINNNRVPWHSIRPALGSIVVRDFTYISWVQTRQAGVMLPEMSISSFSVYYVASTSHALSWRPGYRDKHDGPWLKMISLVEKTPRHQYDEVL